MRRSEEHVFSARAEKGASGLADTRRDSVNITGREIKDVNLIKRISRFAFALKDQRLAVGRKIAFTAATAFVNQLPNVREELRFVALIGFGCGDHACSGPP